MARRKIASTGCIRNYTTLSNGSTELTEGRVHWRGKKSSKESRIELAVHSKISKDVENQLASRVQPIKSKSLAFRSCRPSALAKLGR